MRLTEAELKVAVASLDVDGIGEISFAEFYAWFAGDGASSSGGGGSNDEIGSGSRGDGSVIGEAGLSRPGVVGSVSKAVRAGVAKV